MWNGNDYWDDDDPDYDAVTLNSDWMVINGSALVNEDATNSNTGALYFWRTTLDRIGEVTTPTSGYTETELGGSDVRFHGPFQRRMLLGTYTQGSDAWNTGKYVHLMRY